MQTITKVSESAYHYRAEVLLKRKGTFTDKRERDLVKHGLRSLGYKVKCGSMKMQRLHPEYITDFIGTYETGFGNSDYERIWGTLYTVEILGTVTK